MSRETERLAKEAQKLHDRGIKRMYKGVDERTGDFNPKSLDRAAKDLNKAREIVEDLNSRLNKG